MFALFIELLTGRYTATAFNDRQAPEWPPHPARIYSALVDAWADADQPCKDEEEALRWLESAGVPAIYASTEYSRRRVVTHYVPHNGVTVFVDQRRLESAETALSKAREALSLVEANGGDAGKRQKALKTLERALEKYNLEYARNMAPVTRPTALDVERARNVLPNRPDYRDPRWFPSVTPEDPSIYVIWDCNLPDNHRNALNALASRVVRIGHSSSLVRCKIVDKAPAPTWIPDESGREILRVPGPGQFDALQSAWERHRGVMPRTLPCRFHRFNKVADRPSVTVPHSVFDTEWIVYRFVSGPRYHITRAADLANAVRSSLMRHARQPVPEVLSGLDSEGLPSKRDHVAIVPLPFVGHRYADGSLLGFGIVLPRDIDERDRQALLFAIGQWERSANQVNGDLYDAPVVEIVSDRLSPVCFQRVSWGQPSLTNLRPETWTRPSQAWISVTPVALDRNPGDLYAKEAVKAEKAYEEAAAIIAKSCENIGLPTPVSVKVLPSATMSGTVKARRFPRFPRNKKSFARVQVHAVVEYSEPVQGPVIIGAGRFHGLGLMRPL